MLNALRVILYSVQCIGFDPLTNVDGPKGMHVDAKANVVDIKSIQNNICSLVVIDIAKK